MNINKNTYPVRSAKLKSFIEDYYALEFSNLPPGDCPFQVPPLGFPAMLFSYGQCSNFFNLPNINSRSIIVGQLSKHYILKPIDGTRLFGLNFKPYGFYKLCGIPMEKLKDSAMETSILLGNENVAHIEEMLNSGKSIEDVIGLLEDIILGIPAAGKSNPFLDGIVDHMIEHHGLVNIESLIKDKISVRTLQRYFSEAIGINPKAFCQILRHKFIMDSMYKNPKLMWNELILGGFYYDYSHFKSDFIKFTGVKPIQFLEFKNPFAQAVVDKQ